MTTAGRYLRETLSMTPADTGKIEALLDGLSTADAVAATRCLSGGKLQSRLWKAVEGNPPVCVADLLAAETAPMQPVVFHGKNSLPAFSEFQKICCRPPAEHHEDVLWGYNETRIRNLIGPGYYVVHDTASSPIGGAVFDYTQLPQGHPPGWPDLRANSAGLSRFIYNKTVDYMRRVARDVFIGLATRQGKSLNSYFVLVREPPAEPRR